MEVDQQPVEEEQKNRVYYLRKIIILGIVTGIVVPWVACAVLFVRALNVGRMLEEQNARLEDMAQLLQKQQDQLKEISNFHQEQLSETRDELQDVNQRLEELEQAFADEMQRAEAERQAQFDKMHKVYLTFDDGPSIYTNEILDILKEYDVKATFFVLGKESESSKQALKRIVEEGHSLGMHSYSHQYDQIYASQEAFAEDFQKIRNYLAEVTGMTSWLYRFPGGSSNTITDVDIHVFIDYLLENNTVYYDWNVSSGDAVKGGLSVETILENATQGIERRGTSVVLLHDAASKRTTVDALPLLIETLQSMEDVIILPITEDSKLVQHVKAQEE